MTDNFSFRGHLCIVTELLSLNLYELIKANSFAGFSTVLIRRFTAQILQSLTLLRHHRVVHCDLKPEVRNLEAPRLPELSIDEMKPVERSPQASRKKCRTGHRLWQQLL
jgi:hypothetical protein